MMPPGNRGLFLFSRPMETITRKEQLMADFEIVVEKLQSFETADDLADFFRGYGIKARPQQASSCAISKFVQEETGLSEDIVATNVQSIMVYSDKEDDYRRVEKSVTHTVAMSKFVKKYDNGDYPDLIEDGFVYENLRCKCTVCSKKFSHDGYYE